MSNESSAPRKPIMIPADSPWAHRWKITAGMAVVGIGLASLGAVADSHRFAFSWLFAFAAVMTMALGSIFFVLIQHLTASGWSVTVRRTAEFYAYNIRVLPLLFVPVIFSLGTLYPWWEHAHEQNHSGVAHAQEVEHGAGDAAAVHHEPIAHGAAAHDEHHSPEHQAHEAVLAKKLGYLDAGAFFYIRMAIYFSIWWWLGGWILGLSTQQDRSGDKRLTVQMARRATYSTFLFALSLTFAGFDWFMSLEPNWYSTMFGVRIFASSAVLSFAIVILTTKSLDKHGLVGRLINTEHYHDLGKLMFGFLVFWAYISFSEFFLIWYAAIPEETIYFHRRWDSQSWRLLSSAIVVFKFIVPFYFTMSRNVKRHAALWAGAAWLFTMHFVEMYYWIMPYAAPHEGISLSTTGVMTDVGCLMATVGIYLTAVFYRMTKHSLVAVGDPRLQRAIEFVNA